MIEIEQICRKRAPEYELSFVESKIFGYLLLSTNIKGYLNSLMPWGIITIMLDGFQMVENKV